VSHTGIAVAAPAGDCPTQRVRTQRVGTLLTRPRRSKPCQQLSSVDGPEEPHRPPYFPDRWTDSPLGPEARVAGFGLPCKQIA
jgi:hypothetical protein